MAVTGETVVLKDSVREYKDVRSNLKYLLEGVVISIDPSCGSTSSMPGYAVAIRGELVDSGILPIDPLDLLPRRLQVLSYRMRKLVDQWQPDLLVWEDVPPRRYGGGSAHGHASLIKSVGVVLSTEGPVAWLGLRPRIWTSDKSSTYVKGDEADAREMLTIAITNARWISEVDPPRSYGKGSRSKKAADKEEAYASGKRCRKKAKK